MMRGMRVVCGILAFGAAAAARQNQWEQLIEDGARAVVDRRYPEAEKAFLAAMNQLEGVAESDLRVADTLHELGVVYLHECRYVEAERACLRAVAIRQKNLESAIPTARSELILALVYRSTGQYGEAERWTREAIASLERQHVRPPEIGAAYHTLAQVLFERARFTEAEKAAMAALEAWPPEDSTSRSNRAAVFSTLANVFAFRHSYQQSTEYHAKALATLEEAFGPAHPRLIPALINFADLELQTRNYREAERLARRALDISEAKLGREHLDWATSAVVLGRALAGQSRAGEAESLYLAAILVIERLSGPESRAYGNVLRVYAQLLRQTKRPTEARAAEARASGILTTSTQTVDVIELRQLEK